MGSSGMDAAFLKPAMNLDPSPATGLIPSDSHVDEALVEVALGARRRTPCELELLVRREELPGADQVEPIREPALLRVV